MTAGDIPHLAFPDVDIRALEAEIAREWQQRREFFPGRVAKGNMTEAEAAHQLALAEAWAQDAARIRQAWFVDHAPPPPAAHGVSWRDRRAGLLRELALRDRFYPQWIAGGRLLERTARRQVECLECLLAIYEDGWDWTGSDGRLPSQSAAATEEFNALQAERGARQGTGQLAMAQ